jgi:hypothetical protein
MSFPSERDTLVPASPQTNAMNLLGVYVPEIDGLHLRFARENKPMLPVVAVSGPPLDDLRAQIRVRSCCPDARTRSLRLTRTPLQPAQARAVEGKRLNGNPQ